MAVIVLTKPFVNYVRRNYGSLIGEATAEHIKHEIGTAFPSSEVREIEVRGRNLAEGVPRKLTLNSNEILEAFQEPLAGIVGAVRGALEQAPPELAADIAERGLVLTGGGALIERYRSPFDGRNRFARGDRGRSTDLCRSWRWPCFGADETYAH